jgi:hypothetical protein
MNEGQGSCNEHGEASSGHTQKDRLVCSPRSLPQRVLIKPAQTAVTVNPMNAAIFASAQAATGLNLEPQHIAVLHRNIGACSRDVSRSALWKPAPPSFVPGSGDDGLIYAPAGAPNTVLFAGHQPGSVVIDVITGDRPVGRRVRAVNRQS